MRKRIIALALVLSMSLSFISFAGVPDTNEAIPQVYAYDFYFKDANSDVLKTNTAGEMLAETYAYLTDSKLTELDVTLSIFVYYKNKIIAAESMDETITKTATKITTPTVTVDSAIKDDVLVKAYLTTKDFSCLLAPAAVLGSSYANVEKITVGEYEIFPEDGIYEYNITRYFKAEELTPSLRAYTTDLSTKKEIQSTEENGVIKYTLKTTSCDTLETEEYKINVTPLIATDTSLVGVEINGKTIKDFSLSKKEYTVGISDDKIPTVTAYKFNADAQVTVTDATELPGTSTIKINFENSEEIYKINFVKPTETTLTVVAPYPYLYYDKDKYGFGGRNWFSAKRSSENMAQNDNYVTYAEFPTNELGDIELVGSAELSGKIDRHTLYEFYNTSYDVIDKNCTFDEFTNGSAKLLYSVSTNKNILQDGKLVVTFDSSDIDIKSDGKIKIALVDGSADGSIARFADNEEKTPVYLKIKYVPKNLSKLIDEGFDTSFIEKPLKDEIIKGNASVTAGTEWSDENGITLSKITIDALFPSDCKNKNVLVKVLKPGISETDNKTFTEKYAYIYNTLTDSEGKVKESFNLSCDAGTYTIILSCNGYEKSISTTLTMPSVDKMNELIDGLKGQTYDKDSLSLFMSDNLSGLSLENSLFGNFSEETRKTVSEYILDNIENYTAGGISEILNKASILLGINSNESNETVLKILAVDEIANLLESNENYSDYISLSDKSALFTSIREKEYNSAEEIEASLFSALMVLKVKDISSYLEITEILSNYKDYVTCYDEYDSLSMGENIKVNKYITSNLSSVITPDELNTVIRKGIDRLDADDTPPSRPTGGGGGGGGGGSLSLGEVITPNPVIAEVKLPFTDVSEAFWGYEAIKTLYVKNIISGKSSVLFCPHDKITRAEFAKLITESAGLKGDSITLTFTDVLEKDWYYSYIKAAVENGIILGKSEEVFAPDELITRQDAAVMISRIFKGEQKLSTQKFSDDGAISDYARDAVYILRNKNIVNGADGRFEPLNNLTRAEAAQIISNLLNEIK